MQQNQEFNTFESRKKQQEFEIFLNSLEQNRTESEIFLNSLEENKTEKNKVDKYHNEATSNAYTPKLRNILTEPVEKKPSFYSDGNVDIEDKYIIEGNKLVPRYPDGYTAGIDNKGYYEKKNAIKFKEDIAIYTLISVIVIAVFVLLNTSMFKKK